ncbi:MAG: hypothetical protein AB7S75_10085 [Desulfococcaceae bacterium]
MKWDIKLTLILFIGQVVYGIYLLHEKSFPALGWAIFGVYSVLLLFLVMMVIVDRFPDAKEKIRFYCGILIIVTISIRACAGVM